MPRHEGNNRDRRRRPSPSLSPDDSRGRSTKNNDREAPSTRPRDERATVKDRRRDSRSPARSSRREHKPYRRRSRSRDHDDSRNRKRREDSSDSRHLRRHRDRQEYDEQDGRSKRRRSVSNSRSPPPRRSHRRHSASPPRNPSPPTTTQRSKAPLPSQKDAFSKTPGESGESATPLPDKEKPNFANTGRLAAETNTVKSGDGLTSVVLKYHEPPEARKPPPKDPWRLYVFKGEKLLETIELGGRSCWLIGRERLVVDLPVDHPSCSKQHAALQFRYVEKRNEYGDRDGRVRPYLIDLESANGSTVNGDPAPKGRYMELMDKDILKFGLSTREYVLMLPPSG
ncbi:hypothetical protein FQN53_004511 [Emmonsiellopsis sp. PD_33]|nr:hypothetical protein FQN53_004511 [Emmonsiellopsis sp. PD_33]